MSVSPKRPKGPALNAMRAFEAAARHESFVLAAQELNVTAGAISQHVKTLETWAQTRLFRRNAQGVRLTNAGLSLLPHFSAAFDMLADAARAMQNLKPDAVFHIATLPSVAQLWLPKRLARIRELFPQISFSVTAMESPPLLTRELFDLSIFIMQAERQTDQITLCKDEIAPVCAPFIIDRLTKIEGAPLLCDQTWSDDWSIWSKATGQLVEDPQKAAQYSLYSVAVEEAKAGAGILMGHLCLIEDDLAMGTLVLADKRKCDSGLNLVLRLPHISLQKPQTKEVVALLAEEQKTDR